MLQLAQSLLDRFGGLAGLLNADADALKGVKGLGPAKRAEVAAVLEIARRVLAQQLGEQPLFDAPQRVKDYVALHLRPLGYEAFAVLFLDTRHRLLTISRGCTLVCASVPRNITSSVSRRCRVSRNSTAKASWPSGRKCSAT